MENVINILKQCFCLPGVFLLGVVAVIYIAFYAIYCIFLCILKRLSHRNGIWKILKQKIRLPLFCLLFELATVLSIHILIPGNIKGLGPILRIFIIGTIGWFTVVILRSWYQSYVNRIGNSEKIDQAGRSLFTQILFLYRFSICAICILTLAFILFTFPFVRSIGIGILGSAGIVGIAIGIAARPILLNLMAGFQMAITNIIKIGDTLFIEGESSNVESIHLTHVILRTWDLRRIIIPISYFIDKSFQNWETHDPELQGVVLLYCDYSFPVELLRKKVEELLKPCPYWNKKKWNVYVTNCTENTMQIRVSASAAHPSSAFELSSFLREQLITFFQNEHPDALPTLRIREII